MAHHPVNWLVGEEENLVQNKLLSPSEWNVGLYICGHVHQRDAISWHNAHHSLTTLTTEFGWPDTGAAHSEVRLYSTYVLNTALQRSIRWIFMFALQLMEERLFRISVSMETQKIRIFRKLYTQLIERKMNHLLS